MTGKAENAPGTIDDLTEFLAGQADNAPADEEEVESQPEEGQGETKDETPDETVDDEATSDDETEESAENQASDRKFKVTIKGEDGADVTKEVAEKELLAGYQRQSDYTRKTMELAEQSRQAAQIVQKTVTDGRDYYLKQAQMAKTAILQVAGLKSEQELAQLASTDPAAWVQEQQRIRAIGNYLGQLDEQIAKETTQAQEAQKQQADQIAQESWAKLSEKGIDRPKLIKIYESSVKAYGFKPEEIGANLDPRVVLALKDAIAYRELQDKKPQIANRIKEAEKLPMQKKSLPQNERNNRALDEKFSRGRAKTSDLAAFLANNGF